MTKTNNKLRRLVGLAVKAFILASIVAVILPVPHYARSLGDEEFIVWLARLIWVLLLTVGVGVVLMLVGFLARKLQNKARKTG
ncbi:MAG: hypothetical protein PVG35_04620 [Desulfobacterales bacterium]|jgi:hypothetical protein